MFPQYVTPRADVLPVESLALFLGKGDEAVAPFVAGLGRYGQGNLQRLGAGTFGVAEDVKLGNVETINETVAVLKEGIRLSAHTHDDVHADEGIGHPRVDALYFLAEELCRIASAHQAQDIVAAALQGNVEVGHESAAVGAEVDDVVGQQVGLDA